MTIEISLPLFYLIYGSGVVATFVTTMSTQKSITFMYMIGSFIVAIIFPITIPFCLVVAILGAIFRKIFS